MRPDEVYTLDIKPAADAMLNSIKLAGIELGDAGREDFLLGNIKARQRMVAQFALAGASGGLVIGTDHAASLPGFRLSPLRCSGCGCGPNRTPIEKEEDCPAIPAP